MGKKYLTKKALLAHLWTEHDKYYDFIPVYRLTEDLINRMPGDLYDGRWVYTIKPASRGLAMALNGIKPDCGYIIVKSYRQGLAVVIRDDDNPYRLIFPRQEGDEIFSTKNPDEIWTRARKEKNN